MKAPRMIVSILVSAALGVLMSQLAPQQALVTLYKFSLVTGAGVAGYYLDREIFRMPGPIASWSAVATWCSPPRRSAAPSSLAA